MANVLIEFLRTYRLRRAAVGDVCAVPKSEADRLIEGGIARMMDMKKGKKDRIVTGKGVKQK